MAASGVNEHHEALRKENFNNQQFYRKKLLMEKSGCCSGGENPLLMSRRFCRKSEYAQNDKKSFKIMKQHEILNYSAKINGRFTSTNYCQQW